MPARSALDCGREALYRTVRGEAAAFRFVVRGSSLAMATNLITLGDLLAGRTSPFPSFVVESP
jgi:hypothetical protein